jgi:hypothetical protein
MTFSAPTRQFGAAWIHLRSDERDAALACLSQAVDDRAAGAIYLRADKQVKMSI